MLFFMSFDVEDYGDIGKRPKNTLNFENWIADDNSSEAFSVFYFNSSTVSSFEVTSVDPLIKLNKDFMWDITWNCAAELLKLKQLFSWYSLGSIQRLLLVASIWVSSIKQQIKTKTAVFIPSIHAPDFHKWKWWECRSESSRKPLFGLWLIIITAAKCCCVWGIFSKNLFFVSGADW